MLQLLTVILVAAVTYAFWRERLFTTLAMFINVILAGLVTFNFWEPLANLIEPFLRNTPVLGYEDALVLTLLFAVTLGLLRLAINELARSEIDYPEALDRAGTLLFAALTGYLVSGFLVCVFQTLPWHENFLDYQPRVDTANPVRRYLPADLVWLGMMRRAGVYSFSYRDDPYAGDTANVWDRPMTFDKYATFPLRYARYRRYNDGPDPQRTYQGEFDRAIYRSP